MRIVLPRPSSCFKAVHYVLWRIDYAPSDAGRLCRKLTQNKDFRTLFTCRSHTILVLQCKTLEASVTYCHELENKLTALKPDPRKGPVVEEVRAALPPGSPWRSLVPGSSRGGSPSGGCAAWPHGSAISLMRCAKGERIHGVELLGIRIRVVPQKLSRCRTAPTTSFLKPGCRRGHVRDRRVGQAFESHFLPSTLGVDQPRSSLLFSACPDFVAAEFTDQAVSSRYRSPIASRILCFTNSSS